MCVHTSEYIGETSVSATGVLRDLDSMAYQERVTKRGLFSLIKRASNVGVETGFTRCYKGDAHHLFPRLRTGLEALYTKSNLA